MITGLNIHFSVIMAVYNGDNSEYFDMAIKSLLDQTYPPSEIIVVIDGFINDSLGQIVKKYEKNKLFVFIKLDENKGLANALNIGIENTKYDYIARMDADDICIANRFEKQLIFLQSHQDIDVVGTFVTEINENNKIIKEIVKVPILHKDILNLMKKRNPMIHPSVMFRRKFFEKAGMYQNDLLLAEDYQLWYQGFMENCNFANLPIVGLMFRRTSDFYKRRGNVKKLIILLKYKITKMNKDLKFGIDADIYAILYFLIQISPVFVRKNVYKWLR